MLEFDKLVKLPLMKFTW